MKETSEELPNFSIGIDFLGPDPTSSKKKRGKKLASCAFRKFHVALIFSIFPITFELFIHSYQLTWLTGSSVLAQMWRVFDLTIGMFVYSFVHYENFSLYHNKKSLFVQILDVALL